ncbi:hypothetical protein PR003_g11024 [Phytophthora rubi]|uniref:Uncharacterized protein n=1 Tax=Phytophthora rubi TaxID=129364 RepID=A0A6A3MWU2_9STRA|nr:hypothetical protein PR002_g8540 [Phytophthora rubi]KAE9037941.1 hypothetical protein PR001_g8171 [Phytophthora rubi]KAE9339405.1 hypothetical protein PR003_g11024 [Phytophthora rubi]
MQAGVVAECLYLLLGQLFILSGNLRTDARYSSCLPVSGNNAFPRSLRLWNYVF